MPSSHPAKNTTVDAAWTSCRPAIKTNPVRWIWMKGLRETVDCHLLMRKSFDLSSLPSEGALEIAVSDQYRLFLNGQLVGDGPARSDVPNVYVDRYELSELPLCQGKNVIALLLHNTLMPQHGQSLCPGGAWLEFSYRTGGSTGRLSTDSTWRVLAAPHYAKPAPRRFFAVGFNEDFHPGLEPSGWTAADFDDKAWSRAEVVDPLYFQNRIPRPVPRLRFEFWKPTAIRRHGKLLPLDGVHGLRFSQVSGLNLAQNATFSTYVFSDKKQNVRLRFGCDHWSRVRINEQLVWEQGLPGTQYETHLEKISETHLRRPFKDGQQMEAYTGMTYGNGARQEPSVWRDKPGNEKSFPLKRGWNRLEIWMHRPDQAYGFEFCLLDDATWKRLPAVISATRNRKSPGTWTVTSEAGEPVTVVENPPAWLEPSHLVDWDVQRESKTAPPGAASLLADAKGPGVMELAPGEFIEFRLQADGSGFIDVEMIGPQGALVDITISEAQTALVRGRIRALYNGLWQTDRVTLSGGKDHWLSLDRRSGRYLSICVRQADGPVTVHNFGLRSQHYPADREGSFTCSDPVFNRMWESGAAAVRASSFDLCEDCPTREKAQWQQDTYIRMFLMGALWGDLRMSAKGIREFSEDQESNRWARPCSPSSYGDKLVEGCFLLPIWIRDHYRLSGDRALLSDSFQGVRNLLDFAAAQQDSRGFIRTTHDPRHIIYADHSLVGYLKTLRGPASTFAALEYHHVLALDSAIEQAEILGETNLASVWRERVTQLRGQIQKYYWSETTGCFADALVKGKQQITGNAVTNSWMLLARIATPEQEARVLRHLWPHGRENLDLYEKGESPYSKHFISDMLLQRGMWREAFSVWRRYYGHMLRHPESWAVPESWNMKWSLREPIPGMSLVHAYGIGPMGHLAFYIAGVRPLPAQPDHLLWEPMPGDLAWLKARLPIIGSEGWITVEWKTLPKGGRHLLLRRPGDIRIQASDRYLGPHDRMTVMDA